MKNRRGENLWKSCGTVVGRICEWFVSDWKLTEKWNERTITRAFLKLLEKRLERLQNVTFRTVTKTVF